MIRVLEFKTEYRVGKDPVDWVLIAPIGADFDKTQTWQRVKKMQPAENADDAVQDSLHYQDLKAKWSIIGPAYEAWRNNEDLPEDGTPLAAWSGVTAEQSKFLRAMGIRTVEEVAVMGDAALEKLRWPNARKLPTMAKSWLDGEAVAEKDAKIAEMEEKMAAMEELLAERMKEEPAKRGPGRPKKTESEAA